MASLHNARIGSVLSLVRLLVGDNIRGREHARRTSAILLSAPAYYAIKSLNKDPIAYMLHTIAKHKWPQLVGVRWKYRYHPEQTYQVSRRANVIVVTFCVRPKKGDKRFKETFDRACLAALDVRRGLTSAIKVGILEF